MDHKVWPLVLNSVLQHDAYTCAGSTSDDNASVEAFPTRRDPEGAYAAARMDGPPPAEADCPEECRPEGHKDWNRC